MGIADLTLENLDHLASAIQAFATTVSLAVIGLWAWARYTRQVEGQPNIAFSADLNFVGRHDEWWITEVIAVVENKGKVRHYMTDFAFDLHGLFPYDPSLPDPRWGNQINFPQPIARGSFLPESYEFFFIDPGVAAKYSYVTRIPHEAQFVILHAWFRYRPTWLLRVLRALRVRRPRAFRHVAETTKRLPHPTQPAEDVLPPPIPEPNQPIERTASRRSSA